LGLLAFPGCRSTGPSPKPVSDASQDIEEINLISPQAALNYDTEPGPDGLWLRVYAGNSRQAKPVPIPKGTLEVLLFDGMPKAAELAQTTPLHVWTFRASDLGGCRQQTIIGTSYFLTLLWGNDKPVRNRVTVLARYLPPRGSPVYSTPTVVFVPGN
jgi:hypothetical protein